MNALIAYPRKGPMTQGTIFTCAVAEDYLGCPTRGLVFTARCDIAHDKARVLNYLPIVSLDDWLHRDGRIILAQRLISETLGVMHGVLKDGGYSPAILDTEHPRAILDTLFPNGADGKLRQRFDRACGRFELASRCLSSRPSETLSVSLGHEAPKLREALCSELVHNNLGGFYFLRSIEPSGPDLGHVVLLREIQSVPLELALAVADGLSRELYESMCQSHPLLHNKLSIAPDDFAYPIGQVLSPHLEHLLQTFAWLFSRIGLPDPDKVYVAGLWNRQPTVISSSGHL
jgi:hypothetical protein